MAVSATAAQPHDRLGQANGDPVNTYGAAGYDGQLRVALSDGITPPRLSAFLMQCREEDPEVDIHLVEVPLSQQIKGLHDDLYDVGFAQSDDVGDDLLAELARSDPLVVAVPVRHPLLTHKRIPLEEVLRYPWLKTPRTHARSQIMRYGHAWATK